MLLFFLLTWVNLRASRGILEQQSRTEAASTAEKTNQYLDLYVESIKSLFRYLGTEAEITSDRLRELADMVPLVVETMYLVPDDGPVLCSRQVIYDLLGNSFGTIEPATAGPTLNWTEPYVSNLSGITVAMMQRIRRGAAVVEISIELLREQVAGAAGRADMALLITSPGGHLILDDRESPFSYAMVRETDFLTALKQTPYGVSAFRWDGRSRTILKSRQNGLGWNVHVLIDPAFLERELAVLYRNFRSIGLVLLAVLLISTFGLSLIITRPVRRLAAAMDRVQSLDQVSPISNIYTDELADLVDSYNAMMDRINALTFENDEYEWRMLQSQIGPHFLYNTLTCISALAKRNRVDRVRLALDSLVDLLKYSFGRQSSEVALRDEIEMVRAYVRIQGIRYGDHFSLVVDCPTDELQARVPALILQPIVENSVFYGFGGEAVTGEISVTVRREGPSLSVSVSDNGRGIDTDRLQTVRQGVYATNGERHDFEVTSDDSDTPRDRLSAVGLRNIHRRLQVHYGTDFGIAIESEAGVGTEVVLHLPAILPAG